MIVLTDTIDYWTIRLQYNHPDPTTVAQQLTRFQLIYSIAQSFCLASAIFVHHRFIVRHFAIIFCCSLCQFVGMDSLTKACFGNDLFI